MYKMVSVIGAKWREFIELKEQQQQATSGSDKEKETPVVTSAPAVTTDSSSSSSSKSDTETSAKKEAVAPATDANEEPVASKSTESAAAAADTALSRRGRATRKRGHDYSEGNETEAASAAIAESTANEAAIGKIYSLLIYDMLIYICSVNPYHLKIVW